MQKRTRGETRPEEPTDAVSQRKLAANETGHEWDTGERPVEPLQIDDVVLRISAHQPHKLPRGTRWLSRR